MNSNPQFQNVETAAFLSKQPWDLLFLFLKQNDLKDFKALLTKVISGLDESLSQQLSAIIQSTQFKQLEARWRGIASLTVLPVSSKKVKIKLLDWTWEGISRDLNHSFDLKYSALYKKIYSDEFDTAGGTPFGMLFVDHLVKSDYGDEMDFDDLYTLQLLSELGEVSLCPIALGVDFFFLGDDPSRLFNDCTRAERILNSNDFSSWALLRQKLSSRFLYLVLPEYLMREPFQEYCAGFVFNENRAPEQGLWGNSAHLLIENVIREFDRINWFGFLKSYDLTASFGAIVQRDFPLISRLDLHSEDDAFWSDLGFIPLSSLYLTAQKGFFSNQSVWKIPDDTFRQVASLQTNLMACRFAHYIKMQIRDRVGRFDTPAECTKSLELWLKKYTSNANYADQMVKARFPLKAFRIEIEKMAQDSTRYRCEIMLTLQYQCDLLDVQVLINTSVAHQELRTRS